MRIKINCKSNRDGVWCNDKRIKRSLLGIGAKMCLIAEGKNCQYQLKYPKPEIQPPRQG